MNRRVLKYSVAAALFSAAFLFGTEMSLAETYDNRSVDYTEKVFLEYGIDLGSSTGDDVLVITNNSNIKTNNFEHGKYYNYKNLIVKNGKSMDLYNEDRALLTAGTIGNLNDYDLEYIGQLLNVPKNMSPKMENEFYRATNYSELDENVKSIYYTIEEINQHIATFNKKYNTNIIFIYKKGDKYDNSQYHYQTSILNHLKYDANTGDLSYENLTGYDKISLGTTWSKFEANNEQNITYKDYEYSIDDVSITVSNNSTLISNNNILTSNFIKVTNGSSMQATNKIEGSTISVSNSKITAKSIDATQDIYSDAYINANTKVNASRINIGGVNATTLSTTGNYSIDGIFTTANKANLNGGAALGNKKISSLSAGTLSATSTEAVNGSQLNTIKQKIASIGGKTYTAGSDVAITNANAISVTKSGMVDKGNTGIVTGGAVYKITSALNQSLDSLKASVNSHQSTLTNLSQGLSDLKSSVTNINSSVASATRNLSAQLTNRLQSDMGNLSADGKNVIRNMVSSTLKSMNNMNVKDTTLSPVVTYEVQDSASNTELDTIRTSLDTKADKDDLSGLSSSVASNSKQVEDNAHGIQKNSSAISDLQLSKADADGSNISLDGYSEKLGTGKVEAGNHELINGNTVYDALSKKADIGYVDSGIEMVSSQLDAMSQGLTRDMNRVGAGAAALAGLHPTSYDASDKLSFAYGGGHYKSVNTSALGVFYHPNEKTIVSLAGTIGNVDAMLSAGISIKVGMGDHVSKVMFTPKMFSAQEVANQDMKNHLDTQSERLHQIEVALQNR